MNTKDRVQMMVYVHPNTREVLRRLSQETALPMWKIIEIAAEIIEAKKSSGDHLVLGHASSHRAAANEHGL